MKVLLKSSFLRRQESSFFGFFPLLRFWIPAFAGMTGLLLFPFFAMAADISVHGFFQGNYSFSTKANPDGGDFKWAEERVQLRLDAAKRALLDYS